MQKLNIYKNKQHINQNILDFLVIVLKRFWLLFVIVSISFVVGLFYALSKKTLFESRITFTIDAGSNEAGLSGALNLASQFGLSVGSNQNMFDGDNILVIMKSKRIVEKVLLSSDSFKTGNSTLAEYYIELVGLRKILNKNTNLAGIHFPVGCNKNNFTYQQDSIMNIIYTDFITDYIFADRIDKKLSIYEIKVKCLEERFAKIFTDRLIQESDNFYKEITSKKEKETLGILEERVASLKSSVVSSIENKANSEDENVNPAFSSGKTHAIKQQYNMKVYSEAYGEMYKTLEIARYQYLKEVPLLQIIDFADYPLKKIRKGKLITAIQFALISFALIIFYLWVLWLFRTKITENITLKEM